MELMPMISMQGQLQGLGDTEQVLTILNRASGITSTAVATPAVVSALTAAGVSAQAIPMIGTIAGTVMIISALALRQVAKSKAIGASYQDVETQRVLLEQQSNELDAVIEDAEQAKALIIADVQRSGLAGLGGFRDWIQKTFTPEKYYGEKIATATAQIQELEATNAKKISYLQTLSNELEDLGNKLSKGNLALLMGTGLTRTQKVILYSGLAIGGGTLLYFIVKYFRS